MPRASLLTVPRRVWLMLAAGPALFLLAIASVSIALGIRQVPQEQIAGQVSGLAPQILLGVLVSLAIVLGLQFRTESKVAWRLPESSHPTSDGVVGVLLGTSVAVVYLVWLEPLLEFLQRTVGDYVPPGSVLPTLSGSIGTFFVANVLLAPLVEETLYRGVALPLLTRHTGRTAAILLSCTFFGALHWAGGFWYIVLTGVVGGGIFAGLYYWRNGIVAPFAAHLALNLVEYVYAWRAQVA